MLIYVYLCTVQGTGGKVGDQLPQLPGSSLEDLDDADLDNLQVQG